MRATTLVERECIVCCHCHIALGRCKRACARIRDCFFSIVPTPWCRPCRTKVSLECGDGLLEPVLRSRRVRCTIHIHLVQAQMHHTSRSRDAMEEAHVIYVYHRWYFEWRSGW